MKTSRISKVRSNICERLVFRNEKKQYIIVNYLDVLWMVLFSLVPFFVDWTQMTLSWGSKFVSIVFSFIIHTGNHKFVDTGIRGSDPPRKTRKLVPHEIEPSTVKALFQIIRFSDYWFSLRNVSKMFSLWDLCFPTLDPPFRDLVTLNKLESEDFDLFLFAMGVQLPLKFCLKVRKQFPRECICNFKTYFLLCGHMPQSS